MEGKRPTIILKACQLVCCMETLLGGVVQAWQCVLRCEFRAIFSSGCYETRTWLSTYFTGISQRIVWDIKKQKALLPQNVTVYDFSGWGALWRSECRQKELTNKSDPVCFLVVPESGENWVWIFYPQPHSSTYHFEQLSGQHIEGERWHY